MRITYPPALDYLENQIMAMAPENQAAVRSRLLKWAAFHIPESFECEVDRAVSAVRAEVRP